MDTLFFVRFIENKQIDDNDKSKENNFRKLQLLCII